MEIYTTGFTKKTAGEFFSQLREARIQQLLDVRIHNRSQLAGFTKAQDLEFFLRELCGATYRHEPLLAPTPDLLAAYRHRAMDWVEYEARFTKLLRERAIERALSPEVFAPRTVLLCSEHEPKRCHRRLVAEYLNESWGSVTIRHL